MVVSESASSVLLLGWPSMLCACCRAVCRSCSLIQNVNSVTRAASVPTPVASAFVFLATVGSPWMSQRCFHLGFASSILRSSACVVAAASCFDVWLR